MTKRDFKSKIEEVKRYLIQAKKFSTLNHAQLLASDEKRLAVERALFLVAQSAIDLAESFCHLKKFRRPSSMHEAFAVLCENSVIDEQLCANLLKMVGFRNVLTHGYAKIDYKKLIQVLKSGLKDIEKLIAAVK